MTIASPTYPGRVFLLALTLALWGARFAGGVADALFGLGFSAPAAARVLAAALASAAGALLCLIMGRLLRRFHSGSIGQNIGVLLVVCAGVAIGWTIIVRLAFHPFVRLLMPQAPPLPSDSALSMMFVFFAWAGAWFAVANAERLRQSEARVGRADERILELETLLGAARQDKPGVVSELWAPTRSGMARLPTSEVISLSAEREYVRIHTVSGRIHLVRTSLRGLLERLDPVLFVQVHRSAVVNVAHVAAIEKRGTRGLSVLLDDGRRIAVGRNHVAAVRDLPNTGAAAAK